MSVNLGLTIYLIYNNIYNNINTKNVILEYFKIMENKLIDIFLLLVLLKK